MLWQFLTKFPAKKRVTDEACNRNGCGACQSCSRDLVITEKMNTWMR
jgi:hypothetical protein